MRLSLNFISNPIWDVNGLSGFSFDLEAEKRRSEPRADRAVIWPALWEGAEIGNAPSFVARIPGDR
jgi:hypothetical protein